MIARDTARLKVSFDFPERARMAIRRRPGAWLGSAAVLGFLTAWLSRRSTQVRVQVGKSGKSEVVEDVVKSATWITTVLAIGRAVLPFVRPAVTAFAARQLAEMASKPA